MDFLRLIKEEINDYEKRRGMRESIVVNTCALRELIDRYERLESWERAIQEHQIPGISLHMVLADAITAVYHSHGKNAEATLLTIMDTLKPLIEEKQKAEQIDRVFTRPQNIIKKENLHESVEHPEKGKTKSAQRR